MSGGLSDRLERPWWIPSETGRIGPNVLLLSPKRQCVVALLPSGPLSACLALRSSSPHEIGPSRSQPANYHGLAAEAEDQGGDEDDTAYDRECRKAPACRRAPADTAPLFLSHPTVGQLPRFSTRATRGVYRRVTPERASPGGRTPAPRPGVPQGGERRTCAVACRIAGPASAAALTEKQCPARATESVR
jgi:hypothetical protein